MDLSAAMVYSTHKATVQNLLTRGFDLPGKHSAGVRQKICSQNNGVNLVKIGVLFSWYVSVDLRFAIGS